MLVIDYLQPMEVITMKFGSELRKCRRAARMTQQDLAEETGINRTSISEYENGHVTPDLDNLLKLMKALPNLYKAFGELRKGA